jgi:predicted lipoprotein
MKVVRYIIAIVIIAIVGYNSIYFKKLDEVKRAAAPAFDAAAYAGNFFNTSLMPALDKAVSLNDLLSMLSMSKDKTFDTYAHALAIGNIRYFLVSGRGTIIAIRENDVQLKMDSTGNTITIATEFIYGNAARDATGLVDITKFSSTTDLNNVSAELNKIARNNIVKPFKAIVKKGDNVQFAGAIELNKEHVNTENIEIIPLSLLIQNNHS